MAYFLSIPEPLHRISLFRPKQPNDKIFPDVDFITSGIHWIKYLLSCVTFKGITLSDDDAVVKVILEPEWGIYNRCFYWAYQSAYRKTPITSGFFVARNWTYGTRARREKRDFVNYQRFGELLNDIIETNDRAKLLEEWEKLNTTDVLEGELEKITKRFDQEVLGINMMQFPIIEFLKQVKPNEIDLTERILYSKRFISKFIRIFSELKGVREKMYEHSIFSYRRFVINQLKINNYSELRECSQVDFKVALQKPEDMEPHLSDQGYDAFLILSLLTDNPIFISYLFQIYLNQQAIDFQQDYLNLREETDSNQFQKFLSDIENLLKKYKIDFSIKINNCEFKRMAAWWEFNQFLYFMENIAWKFYIYQIDGYDYNQALKEESVKKHIKNAVIFMKNYQKHHSFYASHIVDKNYESLLLKLDNICPKKNEIIKLIEESVPQSNEYRDSPMLMGLGSFQVWCRELYASLQRGIRC